MTSAVGYLRCRVAPTTKSATLSWRNSGRDSANRTDASSAIIVVKPIRGRIGMRQAPADRPAVAYRTVGDPPRNVRHQPQGDVGNLHRPRSSACVTQAPIASEAVLNIRARAESASTA